MAAAAFGRDLHIDIAFFRNADDRIGTVHAGHRPVYDRSAFIQHHCETDAFGLEPLHGIGGAVAGDLFIDGIFQPDIAGRHESFLQQLFNCAHLREDVAFVIQRAAAVQNAVFHLAGKRRAGPAFLRSRYDVLVSHQQDRQRLGVSALPVIQQRAVVDFPDQGLGAQRKQLFDLLMQTVKLAEILILVFRNGADLQQTAELRGVGIQPGLVNGAGFAGARRRHFHAQGADHGNQQQDQQQNQNPKQNPSEHSHIRFSPFDTADTHTPWRPRPAQPP